MPVQASYPGVYIEEVPSGVRTITGVATSITAFVGRALRGPAEMPVVLTSFADFERRFGGLWAPSRLGYSVRDFFLNGGGVAVVVRLFRPDTGTGVKKARAQLALDPASALVLEAAEEGLWGNSLRARVDHATRPPDPALGETATSLFNLYLRDGTTGVIEEHRNVVVAPADHPRQVTDLGDRRPRRDAAQEADLRLVEVADAREVALVEQRRRDRAVGIGGQAAHGLVGVPVRAEQVGAEVSDKVVLMSGRDEGDVVEVEADRGDALGLEDDPDRVSRSASPRLAGSEDAPRAVHAQVGVQAHAAAFRHSRWRQGGHADEQVLTAAHDLADDVPGQISGRELREAEVRPDDPCPAQRLVQAVRVQPDGVSLGHVPIFPRRTVVPCPPSRSLRPPTLTSSPRRWRSWPTACMP